MIRTFYFLFFLFIANTARSQVIIHNDSLLEYGHTSTTLCFNNSSLMAGNPAGDRFLIYFNSDTIFLLINQSGTWARKIAHMASGIKSASIALYYDTIWICWKEQAYIKTAFSSNNGNNWTILNVSPAGNVSAPSMYAASNGKIHFAWFNESVTDTTVLHNVYFNGSFLPSPNTLSTTGFKSSWPAVTAVGDTVLCGWKETHGTAKIYFARSFNGGQSGTWTPSAFTNGPNTGKDCHLSFAYDINTNTHYVYLVYDGTNKIYIQRSTDFGNIWTSAAVISNTAKNSQFAKVECNNSGFVGVSWEHRSVVSLFDDTKKDVGFAYSTNWANAGSFSNDSLAYTYNSFGSPLASLNKTGENDFYLVWLSRDTVMQKNAIYERHIEFTAATGVDKNTNHLATNIIYPNPSSGFVSIKNNEAGTGIGNISIYNLFGTEVYSRQIISKVETIDISFLENGIYFIKPAHIRTGIHKLIIQKN